MLGGVVSPHEAVGVEVDGLGLMDLAPVEIDVDGAALSRGVEAQGYALADQRGVDFVNETEKTYGAVVLDFADLLEEKELLDITVLE
jgi:hypothetical protein